MSRILIEHVDAIPLTGDPDDALELLHDVNITLDSGVIGSLGQTIPPGFEAEETIDGRGRLALPGLFNAHCHAAMTLVRGCAEDLPFDRWLNERIWVAESALRREDVYWGAQLAACEMIRAGIVGFADHYFWMDQVARVVQDSGLKASLAWCFFGQDPAQEVGETTLETISEFVARWHGAAGGRIQAALGPHSPYMCPPSVLRRMADIAAKLGVGVHLHLAESDQQVRRSRQLHGRSPVAHVEALGLFEVPALAAHCVAVDRDDIEILARGAVQVVHTPKTYMKLGMARPPLRRMLDAGVAVSLGTDGPASNSDLNLLEVMRLVGQQQKQLELDAGAMPVQRLLTMASTAGARAMGFGDSGTLEPGSPADLILVDTTAPHWYPRSNPAAGIVYASHPSDVTHVFVDGKPLLADGSLLTLDEERICQEVERRSGEVFGRAKIRLRTYTG